MGHSQLLGFAVDPDFLSSGYVYAALRTTENDQPVVQLTRWRAADGSVVLNRILVDGLPSGPERTGGVLKFGPDGFLWLGIGDGGSPASDVLPSKMRGVLLRYNKDGTIPADNPSPDSGRMGLGFSRPGGVGMATGHRAPLFAGPGTDHP